MIDPFAAWTNEIFRLYLIMVGTILLLGGALLFFFERILGRNMARIWPIYRSWLVMAPLVLVAVLLGRLAVIFGVAILSVVAFREFSRATGLSRRPWICAVVYLGIFAVAVIAAYRDPRSGVYGGYGLFMALPVYVVGLILLIPILQNRFEGQLEGMALGVMGFIYFGWGLGHLSYLANSSLAVNYLLFLVFAVQLNDVVAFNAGKLFGKHKLRSNISPNKTVEGSLGALAISMIIPWLLAFTFPRFGPLQLLLTGLIIGIGGQLGDLTISAIKRDLGVKDMGTTIPGHGGILDRIDSLIFVTPLFFHMTRYFLGL